MRVRFLFDDRSAQAIPVLRATPHLKTLGIDLSPTHEKCDLLFAQQTCAKAIPEDSAAVVILERIDGAQLTATTRLLLKHRRVLACVKNTIFADLDEYNRTPYRYHENLIRECLGRPKAAPPGLPLDPEHLEKITLGFSFGAYDKLDAFADEPIDFERRRAFDVMFAGTTEYGDDLVTWHRRKCLEAVRQIGKRRPVLCEATRALNHRDYRNMMAQSKIVVAPWGWGEATYREYEGVLSGCTVIKPDCNHMRTADGIRTVPCRPDFEDLPELVESLAEGFSTAAHLEFRKANREAMLKARNPETIANRLAAIFRTSLSRLEQRNYAPDAG